MALHNLKVHSQFWPSLCSGIKMFEVRRNDRKFAVGDVCVFREYSNDVIGYTDKPPIERVITYILTQEDFPVGLQPGFVVLGLAVPKFTEIVQAAYSD